MFFIFDMQVEWTWTISNNYIIKSDVYIKLRYIQIFLDIYQHISYHAQNQKKKENSMSTMKTYQMPNKWQYLKVTFAINYSLSCSAWCIINEFFYLKKKKYFVLEISRFLCFCETCRFQNLWHHHKYCCIMQVTPMLISFES